MTWLMCTLTMSTTQTQTETHQKAVETVIDVAGDGFQIKREKVVACVEDDAQIRAAVVALANCTATESTVEDLHALLKQKLLYKR